MFVMIDYLNLVIILLTEEILHHLGCIKPVTSGINYLSTGAGFFPSTVVVSFVADSHNMWKLVMSIATRVTYACWFGSKYMANRPPTGSGYGQRGIDSKRPFTHSMAVIPGGKR